MYLTQSSENIKQTLTMVYNVALAFAHFPGRFKHAKVVMIPKKTNAVTVNEYRPISLLEVPGEILERLLNDRVQQFLDDNNIFQDEQFRFRRFRGIQQAIAVAYENIAQKIAKLYQVRMVFVT